MSQHYGRDDQPHVGPVILSNILRKGPRPSTVGGRRSVTMDLSRRPGTADSARSNCSVRSVRSVGSVGSVGSNMSNMSNMSRESFSERFGRADKKQKRLLMMQKKIELNETMQKKIQLEHRRPCTPEVLRELSSRVDGMISMEDLHNYDEDQDFGMQGNLFNRMSGRVSVGEALGSAPMVESALLELKRSGMMERPATSQRRVSSSSSLPNVGNSRRAKSAGSVRGSFEAAPTSKPSTPGVYVRPWAQGTTRRPASRSGAGGSAQGSGSLVDTLKARLSESGASRRNITQALSEASAFEGTKCLFVDFENMLKTFGVRLSYMEILFLRKQFGGGGAYLDYQKFTNSFWGVQSGLQGAGPMMMSPLYVHNPMQLADSLRQKLNEILSTTASTVPPGLVLLKSFAAVDRKQTGVVQTAELQGIFRTMGISITADVAKMFGARFNHRQNQKFVDYHRLIATTLPAELTMDDRQLNKSARFFGGETEAGQSHNGPDVTGSFFDINEKIKEEVKGNRKNLQACFELMAVNGSSKLTIPAFCKALSLLKVELSDRSVKKTFKAFIAGGKIDYRRVMSELFPEEEDFRDDVEDKEELDRLETTFRGALDKKWGSVLEAFVEIDLDKDGSVDVAEFGQAMTQNLNMDASQEKIDALVRRFDKDSNGQINFSEFMNIFGQKSSESNLVKTKDVQLIVKQIREAIEARLDGGGGGALLKAFKFFDRDRSGTLTYGEMAAGIEKYANMLLEPHMLAKLMKVYDPDYTGSIDFRKFTENVMGSSTMDASSIVKVDKKKAQSRADPSWTLKQLELGIKAKMERQWTHVKEALRGADTDNSNTINKQELRGLLEQFCFSMDDKQFEQVSSRFFVGGSDEVSYDDFMLYFAKLGGTYYLELGNDMSVLEAQKIIALKIQEKIAGGTGGLLRAFQMFDRDRSGSLSYLEFAQILREIACMTLAPELSTKVMAAYDADGDGEIDYHEFVGHVMGSSSCEASSFEHVLHKKDAQLEASQINTRWEPRLVDKCLKAKLPQRASKIRQGFNACDTSRTGMILVNDVRTVLNKLKLAMTDLQFDGVLSHFDHSSGSIAAADFMGMYVDSSDAIPKDVAIISNLSVADAKELVRQKIKERTGTGQAELLRAFKFFDRDRTGAIGAAEFQEAMKLYASVHFSDEIAQGMIAEFDEDGNGNVDYEEFVRLVMGSTRDDMTSLNTGVQKTSTHVGTDYGNDMMMLRRKVRSSWKELIRAFRDADVDNSGSLDPAELNRVLRRFNVDLTNGQFQSLVQQMDMDHNGMISYGEFMKFFAKGQKEDTVVHKKVVGVSVDEARQMIAEKIEGKLNSSYDNAKLREAFMTFDADRSGSITMEEFRRALVNYTSLEFEDHIMDECMNDYDTDGNGEVDYKEFFNVVGRTGSTGMATNKVAKFRAKDKPAEATKRLSTADRQPSPQPVSRPSTPPTASAAKSSKPNPQAVKMLRFIADKVEQKSRNVRVVFRNFDEDKSGSVDTSEFRRGLAHLGIALSDAEFNMLLDIVDNDGSGTIDYNEFVEDLKHLDEQQGNFMGNPDAEKKIVAAHPTAAPRANAASSDVTHHTLGTGRSGQTILAFIADKVEQKSRNVRVVFRNFDEDKSGSVDYDEFRKGLSHLGINLSDGEFKTLLDIVDNDSSGTIDYNEFVEDLKHVDTQQGGFFGSPEASNKLVAKAKQANVVNLSENMFS